ncbi:hypothetical protein D1007_56980 [Hordeum vulgare]|nr:hypothetical protein D1007_56980 [Hordeum vulgare]
MPALNHPAPPPPHLSRARHLPSSQCRKPPCLSHAMPLPFRSRCRDMHSSPTPRAHAKQCRLGSRYLRIWKSPRSRWRPQIQIHPAAGMDPAPPGRDPTRLSSVLQV